MAYLTDFNTYLLVKDDCSGGGNSAVVYMTFGTMDELREAMRSDYEYELGHGEWDESEIEHRSACLWMDADKLGYDRHIDWYMEHVGRGDGMHVLMEAKVMDGGGIETRVVDRFESINDARKVMRQMYERQMADPFFYAGWDTEYCHISDNAAECTVETRDAQYNLNILTISHWESYIGFEYLG